MTYVRALGPSGLEKVMFIVQTFQCVTIGTSIIIVAMVGHHPISSNRNIQPDLQSPPPPSTSFASHLLKLAGWYDDHEQNYTPHGIQCYENGNIRGVVRMLLHMHRSVICAWQLYYASTTSSCFILQVVIAYSCGMCALWDLKRKVTEGRFFHNNREDIVSNSTNYSSTCIHLGTSFIFCVDLYPGFSSQIFCHNFENK